MTFKLPHHGRYDYQPITERKDYSWPGGKRLALCITTNIEWFAFGAGLGHYTTEGGYLYSNAKVVQVDTNPRGLWQGLRTADIYSEGTTRVSTREMGDAVVKALQVLVHA